MPRAALTRYLRKLPNYVFYARCTPPRWSAVTLNGDLRHAV